MHNFVVHSNESASRKSGRLGLEQVIGRVGIDRICCKGGRGAD